jgi:hypothetical protein
MANAFPTIVPAPYQKTIQDFRQAPVDRSGAVRMNTGSVSIPVATAIGAQIGLIPVTKGCRVEVNGSSVWFDALDSTATATASIGITYGPTSTQTNAPAQYVSGSTSIRAGGNVVLNAVKGGLTYEVLDDGWIMVTTAAAVTDTLGNVQWNIAISYDNIVA